MKFDLKKIREYRLSKGLNQSAFWSRIGVTQSGVSRYESDRDIPTPTAMLLWLLETGRISEKDLAAATKVAKKSLDELG